MRFTLQVYGENVIDRELLRVREFAGDAKPAFGVIAEMMQQDVEKQFDSEGGLASGGWAPLKPATVVAKERKGLDPRILHATLRLRNSLTKKGDPDMNLIITDRWMVFGTHVPYGIFHQLGAPAANLPKRRFMAFGELDIRKYIKVLQRWIMTGGLGL